MKIILGPLQRLAILMEEQIEETKSLQSVISLDLKKSGKDQLGELKTQTGLLEDIKGILRQTQLAALTQSRGPKTGILGGIKSKLPSFKGAKTVAVAVGLFAGAILASTVFFALMPALSARTLLTAVAVAGIMTYVVPKFMELTKLYRFKTKNIVRAAAILPLISMAILASSLPLVLMPTLSLGSLVTAFVVGAALSIFTPSFIKLVHNLKGVKLKDQINAVKAMAIMAGGIVAVSLIFALLGAVSGWAAPPLMWTLQAGLAMLIFSEAFVNIANSLKKSSTKDLLLASTALPLLALTIVGVAYIFKLFPAKPIAPEFGWTLKTGLAMLLFSFAFTKILKVIKQNSLKDIAFAAIGVGLLAAAVVGVAFIFQALSFIDGYEKYAPDPVWALKSGLAILAFTGSYLLISLAAKKIGLKGLALGALAMIAVAGSILATAWIFSVLPSEFIAPPMDWAISAAIAITAFAIPLAVIGALATLLTPVGLLLGAAGIILVAGTMWVVAWIFSKLPDLGEASKNLTDAIMYPVNQMIGALVRFKNEIGIENMVPLAGGILAIAGSWLTLTAAMAGQGIGGAIGAVGNAIGQGVNKIVEFFGGEKAMGPKDLLELLISKADSLKKISGPMYNIGMGLRSIGSSAINVSLALGTLKHFTDDDAVENLQKSAKSVKELAKGYNNIAKSTNLMNIDALNASANMFNAIAKVAGLKGEDAITKISEELMKAVNQLSETVENLQEANGENSTSMQDAISSTIGGFIDKIKGTTDNSGGNESGLVDVAPIVAAIQELEDRLNRPLRVQEI